MVHDKLCPVWFPRVTEPVPLMILIWHTVLGIENTFSEELVQLEKNSLQSAADQSNQTL